MIGGTYDDLRAALADSVDGFTLDIAERIEEVGERFHKAAVEAYREGELFRVHYGRGARDACDQIATVMREAVMAVRAREHERGHER